MAGSSWPDLVAGRTAKASDVEAKFDWSEGDRLPMNSGVTYDITYNLGSAAKRWLGVYTTSINPTSTADGLAVGTTTAHASTIVDISGTKAIRIPRLSTAQITALTPADGMLAFNTTTSQIQVYRNAAWVNVGGTVFRTKAKLKVDVSSITGTALNIASGGGRIIGIALAYHDTVGGGMRVSVILDGETVTSAIATTSAQGFVIRPDGMGHSFLDTTFMGNTESAFHNDISPTSTANNGFFGANYLGWDFASTAAVYVSKSSASGGTCTAHITYAQIV